MAVEVAGYFSNPGSTATFGVLGAAKAALATARAVGAVAGVASQKFSFGGLLKRSFGAGLPLSTGRTLNMSQDSSGAWYYQNGGLVRNAGVLSGSSHAQGGLSVWDNQTGQQVAEFEGKEPVMVLSANTYSNNKSLVDSLLYSSLYRNGAPVTKMQSGGLVTNDDFISTAPDNNSGSNGASIAALEAKFDQLIEVVNNQSQNMRAYVVYQDIQESDKKINDIVSRNSLG